MQKDPGDVILARTDGLPFSVPLFEALDAFLKKQYEVVSEEPERASYLLTKAAFDTYYVRSGGPPPPPPERGYGVHNAAIATGGGQGATGNVNERGGEDRPQSLRRGDRVTVQARARVCFSFWVNAIF